MGSSDQAVIFDVDGTLIDTVDLHAHAWVEALRHFGFDLPFDDLRVQLGRGGDQILHGLLSPEEVEARSQENVAIAIPFFLAFLAYWTR